MSLRSNNAIEAFPGSFSLFWLSLSVRVAQGKDFTDTNSQAHKMFGITVSYPSSSLWNCWMLGQSQIQAISLVHKVTYSVLLLTDTLFFKNDIMVFAIFILIFENVFIWLPWVLVTTRGIFDLQLRQVGSSSLTWDRTWAPCLGSMESFLAAGSTGKSQ